MSKLAPNQKVVLYGAERCHKTQFYLNLLKEKSLIFEFYDVEMDLVAAEGLKALYENRKLNFPTFTIDGEKLRNPSVEQLEKKLFKPKTQ